MRFLPTFTLSCYTHLTISNRARYFEIDAKIVGSSKPIQVGHEEKKKKYLKKEFFKNSLRITIKNFQNMEG